MKTDSQIQGDVMNELKWDPSVTHEHIGVSVSDGIVTLSGHVPTYLERTESEKCAHRVSGVKAVVNKLEVKIFSSFERDDEDIARAVLDAFKWNLQIPEKNIEIGVKDGWVTLRGSVEWEFQRSAAEGAVKVLTGVTGVTNAISLKPKILASGIKTKIEEALKRAAEREANRIDVRVDGSRVTLSGKVRSFSELVDARGAAWSAPGVTEVQDYLKIAS